MPTSDRSIATGPDGCADWTGLAGHDPRCMDRPSIRVYPYPKIGFSGIAICFRNPQSGVYTLGSWR